MNDDMLRHVLSIAMVLSVAVSVTGCKQKKSTTSTGNEVVETAAAIDLPAPPEFKEPEVNKDGTHSVVEMRRKSGKYMSQQLKLTGYVLYKYDCATVLGEKVAKDNPEQCERPHFYLGDDPKTSLERAVWVVEVPRAPRPDEKKALPKEELNDPNLWPPEPKYAQGDKVEVEGTWDVKSPKGFVNSEGLLIYKNMVVTVNADGTAAPPPEGGAPAPAPGGAPAPAPAPGAAPPTRQPPPH
jgi:hypothetical protein